MESQEYFDFDLLKLIKKAHKVCLQVIQVFYIKLWCKYTLCVRLWPQSTYGQTDRQTRQSVHIIIFRKHKAFIEKSFQFVFVFIGDWKTNCFRIFKILCIKWWTERYKIDRKKIIESFKWKKSWELVFLFVCFFLSLLKGLE